MEIILNLIFEFVATIILLVISKHVIPWLKEKKLCDAAKIAVEAAEQLITQSGQGKLKFEQAKAWLSTKFKLSDEELEKIIESADYKIKNEFKQ